MRRFAEAEGDDVKLLTHHYYRGQQGPGSSYDLLLRPDPGLLAMLQEMREAARGVPYRICETNSFSGGGRPGISGTFGAALWVLDYFWTLLAHGAAGVNLETGVNQLGFVSSYSPIGDEVPARPVARPEYYGMLAFAQGARGSRVGVRTEADSVNLTAYAAVAGREVLVTLINKDGTRAAEVELRCGGSIRAAKVVRLEAAGLESVAGVTLGGAGVGEDGRWSVRRAEPVRVAKGKAVLRVPAASAAVVSLAL